MEEHGAGSLSFPQQEHGVGSGEGPVLSDLLILAVRGRDLFLAVSVESWIPTVLGASLDHLVQLKKPIRATTLSDRAAIGRSSLVGLDAGGKEGTVTPGTATAKTVPLVIRRLVAFLAENGLGLPDLFQAKVEEENVREILRCLDTASQGICSLTSCLFTSLTKRMSFHRATPFRKSLRPIRISSRG